MPTIVISFLTPSIVLSSEIADDFFSLIRTRLDGASLGVFGDAEPLMKTFEDDWQLACELWRNNLFWAEQCRNGSGGAIHGSARRHTDISFNFDSPTVNGGDWTNFVRSASQLLKVDYSCAHWFDTNSATEEDAAFEGITSHDIQNGLPGIPWVSCYGRPYLEMIGVSTFHSAPFDQVEVLDDLIFCQLTSDPNDYVARYELFKERQQAAKACLGNKFFIDAENALAPNFRFENPVPFRM